MFTTTFGSEYATLTYMYRNPDGQFDAIGNTWIFDNEDSLINWAIVDGAGELEGLIRESLRKRQVVKHVPSACEIEQFDFEAGATTYIFAQTGRVMHVGGSEAIHPVSRR